MTTNCVNCGAPIESSDGKCKYCGTVHNLMRVDEPFTPFDVTMAMNGDTVKGYVANIEYQPTQLLDYRDEKGRLVRCTNKPKRIFTIVEY